MKRRVASLPPISLDAFNGHTEEQDQSCKASIKKTSDEAPSEKPNNKGVQSASPFQCLFCSQEFANYDTDFTMNLEHMRTAHGMLLPNLEMVVNMQSLMEYIARKVRVWNQCLYCNATRASTMSIQNHMKDKGHRMINLDQELGLLDFWKGSEGVNDDDDTAAIPVQESPLCLSPTGMRCASGRVIYSRHAAAAIKRVSRARSLTASSRKAVPPGSEGQGPSPPAIRPGRASCRQLTHREEMSIQGVSWHQRQALVLTAEKAQRSEAVARNARDWVYAKAANAQKFDQVNNQMKWGKQNHKLLPR
jgi:pre-60S factor REI1